MREKSRKRKFRKRWFGSLFFLLFIGGYLALILIPQRIAVTYYALDKETSTTADSIQTLTDSTTIQSFIRIVQLTDLHNAVFGNDNDILITLVAEQTPDLIVMTGDMINLDNPDLTIIKNLIIGLSQIAPVYYGYGNHETAWEQNYGYTLHEELSSVGAIVLDDEYCDIDINGIPIRIGGFRGFYGFAHMDGQDEAQKVRDKNFFDNFKDTDRYRILLNHIPTQWVDWNYIDSWHTGLIFSGHYHGGQIVLPLIGALYAPYVGWFPKYTHGCYEGETSTCILSSGLGSERAWIPRINNSPEIVVVDLK